MSDTRIRKPDPTDDDGVRELAFFPADADAATTLTTNQIDGFNAEGFVSGIGARG